MFNDFFFVNNFQQYTVLEGFFLINFTVFYFPVYVFVTIWNDFFQGPKVLAHIMSQWHYDDNLH